MFHKFNPSGISWSSQRLIKLLSQYQKEQKVSSIEAPESGFELKITSVNAHFKGFNLVLGQNLKDDSFLRGFFLGHARLLNNRPVASAGAMSFREWESYFRDLNHQECVGPEQFSLALKLHEVLSEILINTIIESAWSAVSAPQMPSGNVLWIERLQWLDVALSEFFAEIFSRKCTLSLLSWSTLVQNESEYQLVLERPRGLEMSERFASSLEKFLIRTLADTKEIKLVAE